MQLKTQRVKLIVERRVFQQALRESGLELIEVARGGASVPAFRGTAAGLATFILASQATFGHYDSNMLAQIVRSVPAERELTLFYYPGLELF